MLLMTPREPTLPVSRTLVSLIRHTLTQTAGLESQVYYWTFIETNVGVLSVCLPTLGPIKERFKERLKELYSPKSPVSKALASLTKLFSLGRKVGDVRPGSIEDGSHPEISQQPHDETEQSLRVR